MTNTEADPKKVSILLVDDDADDLFFAQCLLKEIKQFTAEVEVASTYDEALILFRENRHDVYLLDYRLGKLSGLDLLQEFVPNGPVIMLTGQNDSGIDLLAIKAGASDYLVKDSLNVNSLSRTVDYAIERSRFRGLSDDGRERIEVALKSAGIGTWTWDFKEDNIEWDEHLQALFKSSGNATPKTIDEFLAIINAEDRPLVEAAFEECRRKSAPFDIQCRIISGADAAALKIEIRGKCSIDAESGENLFAGVCWEIFTQRKNKL